MITKETLENMTDEEFDNYLADRSKTKPYLDRFVREGGYNMPINFEDWLKQTLRDERLEELLNGR